MAPVNRRRIRWAGIVAVGALLMWMIWNHEDGSVALRPGTTMSAAQLADIPDFALIRAVFADLQVKYQVGPADSRRWRALPDPVRHVLVQAWVEEKFPGFAALLVHGRSSSFGFTADDLATAYAAIDATGVVAVVREAERLARADPDQVAALALLDSSFIEQRRLAKVPERIRAAIRAQGESIAAASF